MSEQEPVLWKDGCVFFIAPVSHRQVKWVAPILGLALGLGSKQPAGSAGSATGPGDRPWVPAPYVRGALRGELAGRAFPRSAPRTLVSYSPEAFCHCVQQSRVCPTSMTGLSSRRVSAF